MIIEPGLAGEHLDLVAVVLDLVLVPGDQALPAFRAQLRHPVAKELSSFDAVIVEIQRSIPWPTTRIRTKSNRAKKSLGRSITTRATCPAKRSAKMNPNSPTLTGNKVVTINKMKSAEFARADAGGIFEVHKSFGRLEHLTEEELKDLRGRCWARAKGEIGAVTAKERAQASCHRLRRDHWLAIVAREFCRGARSAPVPVITYVLRSSNCTEQCYTDVARPWT
jgi:hypothetical protein